MKLRSTQTLGNLPSESWNSLSGAKSLYLCYDWLCYAERGRDSEPNYLVVSSAQNEILGALPIYSISKENNVNYRTDHVLEGRLAGRYLLAGTRRGYVNDLLLHPALDEGEKAQVLSVILEEAERRASELDLDGVLFLYLTTKAAATLFQIRSTLQPSLLSLDTVLPVVGDGIDDYLRALASRRAYSIRKEIRRFQDFGYEIAIEQLADCWREAGPLVSNVQQRYGHMDSPQACSESLHSQANFLNKYARVFTARRDGQLVAFSLFYSWNDILFGRLVGFDYDKLNNVNEYFNLFYYQPLQLAFRARYKSLNLGRKSYESKLRRGAIPRALWAIALSNKNSIQDWRDLNAVKLAKWQEELHIDNIDVPPEWITHDA